MNGSLLFESPSDGCRILDLGRVRYAEAYRAMLETHAAIASGTRPSEVWLVEHPPVFTAGRATERETVAALTRSDIELVQIERGGRITFHGPGQLVVYPIVRLPRRDVRAWLQALEQFGIALCRDFGLDAEPSVDGTGVFVAGRKVSSIGVAIKRWTNLHGIAINYAMDLAPFFAVRPCGLDPAVMSDLSTCASRQVERAEVVQAAVDALPALLGYGDAT